MKVVSIKAFSYNHQDVTAFQSFQVFLVTSSYQEISQRYQFCCKAFLLSCLYRSQYFKPSFFASKYLLSRAYARLLSYSPFSLISLNWVIHQRKRTQPTFNNLNPLCYQSDPLRCRQASCHLANDLVIYHFFFSFCY